MTEAPVVVDRFSALPSEVALHILAFLPIADVTRVSSLSKRCGRLHLSNTILNFNSFPSQSTITFDKRLELLNSLDRFLIQRGNNKVKNFSINWSSGYHFGETETASHCTVEKSRIMGWIQNAVHCNVEVLYVYFGTTSGDFLHGTHKYFPSCVFACESLRYLTLDKSSLILKAPSFSTSHTSNLVSLSLRNVTVEDGEEFCKWVSCCRFIKKLELKGIDGLKKITIESSSLESFSFQCLILLDIECLEISGDKIEEICIDLEHNSGKFNKSWLYISAPNLKYLKWFGNMLNHQQLGEMNCLEKVELSLTAYGVSELDCVCEQLLSSLSSVRVLILDQVTAKTLFREGFTPAPSCNVWYLRIPIWHSIDDKLVPAMASLFRAVPNLSTLNVSLSLQLTFPGVRDDVSGFDRGYWEHQGLHFISKLKEVTIELTTGSNGFELARYMLEHAPNLKKISVIISPDQSSLIRELRRTNCTSNARVIFLKKRLLRCPRSCLMTKSYG